MSEVSGGDFELRSRKVGVSPSYGGKALIVIAALFLMGASVALFAQFGISTDHRSSLRVSKSGLNFGIAPPRPDFPWTIELFNDGRDEIVISHFSSSCRCTSVTPERLTIPPKQAAKLTLHLDLSPTAEFDLTQSTREFSVNLSANIEGRESSTEPWVVHGVVESPFTSKQPGFNFERPLVKGRPYSTSTIEILTVKPATAVTAQCDPAYAAVEIKKLDALSRHFSLALTPNSNLPIGVFDVAVVVSVVCDGDTLTPLSLNARGEIVSDIHAIPREIDFGVVLRGQRAAQTLNIQSYLDSKFELLDIVPSAARDVSAINNPRGLNTHSESEITGRFNTLGSHSSLLQLSLKTSTGEVIGLSVPVSAYVIEK